MISYLMLLIAPVLSGFGRRFQGGLLSQWCNKDLGDVPVRILWGLICAAIAFIFSASLLLSAIIGIGIFVGSTLGYWGSMKAGTLSGGHSLFLGYSSKLFWKDMGFLTLHGFLGTIIPTIAIWWFGFTWWPILIAGLLCGPLYRLAYIWTWNIPVLGCLNNEKDFDPPPTAEFLYGGLIGLALTLAFIL